MRLREGRRTSLAGEEEAEAERWPPVWTWCAVNRDIDKAPRCAKHFAAEQQIPRAPSLTTDLTPPTPPAQNSSGSRKPTLSTRQCLARPCRRYNRPALERTERLMAPTCRRNSRHPYPNAPRGTTQNKRGAPADKSMEPDLSRWLAMHSSESDGWWWELGNAAFQLRMSQVLRHAKTTDQKAMTQEMTSVPDIVETGAQEGAL
ncbi:hypothetical protein AC579_5371 [Pseudocercospora musae]|uniref:Uncharacterized protein n=1 Tax=Pseudocercospora musae TaxID=113226 RepID=A0A139H3U9_9PEZI|nr:hypothetical protein AC579_5371 [Pseudocercospora musae]